MVQNAPTWEAPQQQEGSVKNPINVDNDDNPVVPAPVFALNAATSTSAGQQVATDQRSDKPRVPSASEWESIMNIIPNDNTESNPATSTSADQHATPNVGSDVQTPDPATSEEDMLEKGARQYLNVPPDRTLEQAFTVLSATVPTPEPPFAATASETLAMAQNRPPPLSRTDSGLGVAPEAQTTDQQQWYQQFMRMLQAEMDCMDEAERSKRPIGWPIGWKWH